MSSSKDTPAYAEWLGLAAFFLAYFGGRYFIGHPLEPLSWVGLFYLSSRLQQAVEALGRFEVSTRPTAPPQPEGVLFREKYPADFPGHLQQLKALGITIAEVRKVGNSSSIRFQLLLTAPEMPSGWWWETEGQYLTLETALNRLIEYQKQPPARI